MLVYHKYGIQKYITTFVDSNPCTSVPISVSHLCLLDEFTLYIMAFITCNPCVALSPYQSWPLISQFVLRWPCTVDRTSKSSNYMTPQLICWQIMNIFCISCIETVVLSLSVLRLSRCLPQEHSGPGSAWPAVCRDGELQQQSDQPEHYRQQFRPPWSPASLRLLPRGHWRFCWWSWGHQGPVGWGHGLWIRGAIHVHCITCHDGECC